MGKKFWKIVFVFTTVVISILICISGYLYSNHKQREQQIAYSAIALKQMQKELKESQRQIDESYADSDQVFLKTDLKEKKLTAIAANLTAINSTIVDSRVGLDEKSRKIKELQSKRRDIENKLDRLRERFTRQEKVNQLFTQSISNWQQPQNDVVIRADLTEDRINQAKKAIKKAPKDEWKNVAQEYLNYADAQLNRVQNIKSTIARMLKDDKITEEATYEAYLNLVNEIEPVRNPELKATFTESAQKIRTQIGADIDY